MVSDERILFTLSALNDILTVEGILINARLPSEVLFAQEQVRGVTMKQHAASL